MSPAVAAQTQNLSGEFIKKKYGPDLKIFLSPQSVSAASGKTATQDTVLISALNSNKGGQDYVIPSDVNLAHFQSILIHCEAYSVI